MPALVFAMGLGAPPGSAAEGDDALRRLDPTRDLSLTAPAGRTRIPFPPETAGFIDGGDGPVRIELAGMEVIGGRLDFRLLRQAATSLLERATIAPHPDQRLQVDTRDPTLASVNFRALLRPRLLRCTLDAGAAQDRISYTLVMEDLGDFTGRIRGRHGDWTPLRGHGSRLVAHIVGARTDGALAGLHIERLSIHGGDAPARVLLEDAEFPVGLESAIVHLDFDAQGRLATVAGAMDGTLYGPPDAGELPPWTLHAPAPQWRGGVISATRGFVLESGNQRLLGDALRWDRRTAELFATGRILLTRPGLRLHAEHLGGRGTPQDATRQGPPLERGEAWQVRAWLLGAGRDLRLHARHCRYDPEQAVFEQVEGDGGHGALLALAASRITAYLRDQPATDRKGIERSVAGILATNPRISAGGIPVFWAPLLYRDFVLDYPWSHYRYRYASRQGNSIEALLRYPLPPLLGWHADLTGIARFHERNDHGFGGRARWRKPGRGAGEALWFGLDEEAVRRSKHQVLEHREAHVADFAQRLAFPGGGLYARWTRLPDADAGVPWDERFRADYLEADIEHRPFARRGIAAAWSLALGTLTADIDTRPHPQAPGSERNGAIGLTIPGVQLLGPLHIEAAGEHAWLHAPDDNDRAARQHYRAGFNASHWFDCGIGFESALGLRGNNYEELRLAGEAVDDVHYLVPYADATAKLRLQAHFKEDWTHVITPALGLEWFGKRSGEAPPPVAFDDADDLDEDLRLLTAGLESSLAHKRVVLQLDLETRWLLRDEVRRGEQLVRGELLDAKLQATGHPSSALSIDANATWDGIADQWRAFDATVAATIAKRVTLREKAVWRSRTERWEHEPELLLRGNRYTLGAGVQINDTTTREIDRLEIEVLRRMVDGEIGLGYELGYDVDDERTHSFSFTFSFKPLAPR